MRIDSKAQVSTRRALKLAEPVLTTSELMAPSVNSGSLTRTLSAVKLPTGVLTTSELTAPSVQVGHGPTEPC